jgi:hypothetical protein
MKRFFKLFLFGGVFTLLITGCDIAKSSIEVDETILSSLPDSVRQDALYRMITYAETANNTNSLVYREFLNDNFLIPIIICTLIAVSTLLFVFMVLKSHSRNLKMGYDNLHRLLEKNANSLPQVEVIELFTANNSFKKRKPYIFDATFVGIGIGVFLLGLFVEEDGAMGIGAIIFFFGLMRLLIRLFLDRQEKK